MAKDSGKGTLETGRREGITNRHEESLEKNKYFAAFKMALLSNGLKYAKIYQIVHFTHCLVSIHHCSVKIYLGLSILVHKWCEIDLSYYSAT